MKDLAGRTAVVTGGASGIGKATAQAMVAEGMNVVIADIEAGRLEQTAQEIGAVGQATDVSKLEDMQALASAATERFGAVDVLFNNAGIGPMAKLADLTHQDWQWMISVNLWGVINGLEAFLPILRTNPKGAHIVNTSSMAGLMAVPTLVTYCTTKYAIVGLSEAVAADLELEGSDIGVSILCPGPVSTDLGSSTRNRPKELAGGLADVMLEDSTQFAEQAIDWRSPEETAELVLHAIRHNQRYVITHPAMLPEIEARHRGIEQAFRDAGERAAERRTKS